MSHWRPKDRAPANVNVLHRWIADHSKATGILVIQLQQRISVMAIAGAIDRARDAADGRVFLLKGGIAIELRAQFGARLTRDLDIAHRLPVDDVLDGLDTALAKPVGDFTFERAGEPYFHPDIPLVVTEVRVLYRSRVFQKVKLELMAAEGQSADEAEIVPAFEITEYGLDGPVEVACLTLRYQLAQKLHACTSVRHDGEPNDRWRDLVDIILIRGMLADRHLPTVRRACVEIFVLRDQHNWPPTIKAPMHWAARYSEEVVQLRFPIATVEEAVDRVNDIVSEIDAAR